MGKGRTFFGVLLSAIYLIWVASLVLPKIGTLTSMDLNSIGDFFAGIFGPLAFLWLVLGYFQQGAELRQNNEALMIQAEELRNSVAQQRELVAVTARQVEHVLEHSRFERMNVEAQAAPKFNVKAVGFDSLGESVELMFEVANVGEAASFVEIFLMYGDGNEERVYSQGIFSKGVSHVFTISMLSKNIVDLSKSLKITCQNIFGTKVEFIYRLSIHTISGGQPVVKISRKS